MKATDNHLLFWVIELQSNPVNTNADGEGGGGTESVRNI